MTGWYYPLEEDWNVDSGDALRKNARAADIVKEATPAKLPRTPHVLLHGGENREQTVAALPEIIRYYKARGYRFAKLDADVEPVQFRCSPGSLAVRPMTEERFAGLLSEARQVAAAREVGTEVPLISEGLETEGPPPAAGAANDRLQGLLWAQAAVVLATPVIVGLSSYTGYRSR